MSCEASSCQFACLEGSIGQFNHCGGLLKLWHGTFSARKDLESSFNHYGSPVKLVHGSLSVRKYNTSTWRAYTWRGLVFTRGAPTWQVSETTLYLRCWNPVLLEDGSQCKCQKPKTHTKGTAYAHSTFQPIQIQLSGYSTSWNFDKLSSH